MRWHDLNRSYKKFHRYKDIARILLKHGFSFLHKKLELPLVGNYSTWVFPESQNQTDAPIEVRLRKVFEDLGPGFIKLGQILSVRPDLIPPQFANEFKTLQSNVKPHPFEEIEPLIEQDIPDYKNRFSKIDVVALGTGSIAQVHPAVLHDGSQVVIKIQRPDVKANFLVDIDIIEDFSILLEKRIPELKSFRLQQIVEEFKIQILNELNFKIEAFHQEKFQKEMLTCKGIHVPRIFSEFTTERLMVSERAMGFSLETYLKNPKNHQFGVDEIAHVATNAFFKQVMVYGFFHADPHPGNIKIDDDAKKIIFLDFGFMGRLSEDLKASFIELFYAFIQKDEERVTDVLLQFSQEGPDIPEKARLRESIQFFIDFYHNKRVEEINLGQTFMEIIEVSRKFKIIPPPQFVILAKALVTIESFARDLVPHYSLIETAEPYLKKAVYEIYNPKKILNQYTREGKGLLKYITKLPHTLNRLLHQLEKGETKFEFLISDLPELSDNIVRGTTRMSISLIIASLLLSSSYLLVNFEKGIAIKGIPLFGILGFMGFALALFFGFWLIIFVLRSGRI